MKTFYLFVMRLFEILDKPTTFIRHTIRSWNWLAVLVILNKHWNVCDSNSFHNNHHLTGKIFHNHNRAEDTICTWLITTTGTHVAQPDVGCSSSPAVPSVRLYWLVVICVLYNVQFHNTTLEVASTVNVLPLHFLPPRRPSLPSPRMARYYQLSERYDIANHHHLAG